MNILNIFATYLEICTGFLFLKYETNMAQDKSKFKKSK